MINRNSDNDRRFQGRNLALYVFESIMAVFYLVVAYIILCTERFDSIGKEIRLPLGILLGVYGLFRVYRAIRRFFT